MPRLSAVSSMLLGLIGLFILCAYQLYVSVFTEHAPVDIRIYIVFLAMILFVGLLKFCRLPLGVYVVLKYVGIAVVIFSIQILSETPLTIQPIEAKTLPAAIEEVVQEVKPVAEAVFISIPSIHVSAHVVEIGITTGGGMGSPKQPEEVGWYSLGARPGEQGQAIVVGHSGWINSRAVAFDDLDQLQLGQSIYIRDTTGKTHEYIAREIHSYDWDINTADILPADGGSTLTLITCSGDWDASKQMYKLRLVVTAGLVR